MLGDDTIGGIAAALAAVPGVVGVLLGGSRARGEGPPSSDVDLGIYYDGDVPALEALAAHLTGAPVPVAGPQGRGSWVDGGAWLSVGGTPVEWILRELSRVEQQGARARRGQFAFHAQPGHPLGFLDVSYAGELALGRILADPAGRLRGLRERVRAYPPVLATALVRRSREEAEFTATCTAKGVPRRDTVYVAQCLSRVLLLCAHAAHAHAGRWLLNEKGAVPAAAALPGAPEGCGRWAATVLGGLGDDEDRLHAAVAAAHACVRETGAWTGTRRRTAGPPAAVRQDHAGPRRSTPGCSARSAPATAPNRWSSPTRPG